MDPIIIPILGILVGIIAIISGSHYKLQKLKLESGSSNEDRKLLAQTVSDNKILQERVENLEYIITSLDKDLLTLNAIEKLEDPSKKVKQLAQELNKDV